MNIFSILLAVFPLLGNQTYPESISYHAGRNSFFVSGAGDGSVQEVSAAGEAHYFLPPGSDGREEAYGVKVDEARNRLWLVDGKNIFVYSLSSKALLAKISRASLGAPVGESFLNDIALDAKGNAYVTDSSDPSLVIVNGETLLATVRALTGIPFGKQNDIRYNLNGIVLAPKGDGLLSVKTNDGSLWFIPSDAGSPPREIKLSAPVVRGDGLAWAPNGKLLVARNYVDKISEIDIASELEIKPVRDLEATGLATPTALAIGADGNALVVNSQFAKDKPELPFGLSVMSLPTN